MNKPKELKGEVKKFEEWVRDVGIHFFVLYRAADLELSNEIMLGWKKIVSFYTQTFKSEMIEKYFEAKNINTEEYKQIIFSINKKDVYITTIESGELWFSGRDYGKSIKHNHPKTLSDFIDACLNSDIKLNWKSN